MIMSERAGIKNFSKIIYRGWFILAFFLDITIDGFYLRRIHINKVISIGFNFATVTLG